MKAGLRPVGPDVGLICYLVVATDMHKRRASQAGRFANSTKVEWTLTARGTSLSFADGRFRDAAPGEAGGRRRTFQLIRNAREIALRATDWRPAPPCERKDIGGVREDGFPLVAQAKGGGWFDCLSKTEWISVYATEGIAWGRREKGSPGGRLSPEVAIFRPRQSVVVANPARRSKSTNSVFRN